MRLPENNMPRRKKTTVTDLVTIPASVKEDAKALGGIVNKWSKHLELATDEVFAWAKKHKFLLAFGTFLFLALKYLFDEQKKKEEDY